MEQKKSVTQYNLISGILFVVIAIFSLIYTISILFSVLNIAGYAVIAFALISKRRDIILPIGFAVLALISLVGMFFGVSLHGLCRFIALLGTTFICIVYMTEYLPQYKEQIKNLWFAPAALLAVGGVLGVLSTFVLGRGYGFRSFLLELIVAGGVLFASIWVVYPDGLPKTEFTQKASNTTSGCTTAEITSEIYCGLLKHVLLLIFTFGIWFLIWIYRMTGYTNNVEGEEERNPTTKLLLCLFVPFYQIFWTYKTAQRIDKIAKSKYVSSDLSTLCLILAIFVPIIPPILMQDKMNTIVTTTPEMVVKEQEYTAKEQQKATLGTADELKTYKELLDSGVITQEEFDAKKKQLLGL